MSTLSDGTALPRAVYGYQFVPGLGIGLTLSSSTMMTILANSPDNGGMFISFPVQVQII